MKSKTVEVANNLLGKSKSKEVETEVIEAKKLDKIDQTKDSILGFICGTLQKIDEDCELKAIIKEELKERILNPEEGERLSNSQLIGMFNNVGEDITRSRDSVFSMVKPIPNATNPLLDKSSAEERDKNHFADATSKDMRNMQILSNMLEQHNLAEQMKNTEKLMAMQNQTTILSED